MCHELNARHFFPLQITALFVERLVALGTKMIVLGDKYFVMKPLVSGVYAFSCVLYFWHSLVVVRSDVSDCITSCTSELFLFVHLW